MYCKNYSNSLVNILQCLTLKTCFMIHIYCKLTVLYWKLCCQCIYYIFPSVNIYIYFKARLYHSHYSQSTLLTVSYLQLQH